MEEAGAQAEQEYLRRIGDRVRKARALRGVTRRSLAADSGVSERYLAQLESGEANVSVLLLRDIAQALELPMEDFLAEGAQLSPNLLHATTLLRQLSPQKLAEARYLLNSHFAPADGRMERIAIIGLRGAGKSTLGQMLADRLAVPFLELDRMIEQASGISIGMVFDMYGQDGFRRMERQCLEEVLEKHPRFVLATSGSLVSDPETYDRLRAACYTVWLRATPEDHMQRVIDQGDMRPMGENREAMADLQRILSEREPLYGKADAAISTSGHAPEVVVDALFQEIAQRRRKPR